MVNKLSTYERKMKEPQFKIAYEKHYQKLLSEHMSLLEEDNKSPFEINNPSSRIQKSKK